MGSSGPQRTKGVQAGLHYGLTAMRDGDMEAERLE